MESTTKLPSHLKILHLEDSELDHQLVCRTLSKAGVPFAIHRVDSLGEFIGAIKDENFDVVLADYRLSGFTALDAWAAISQYSPPPFILLSGAIGETAAVSAIHLGVSDYLHKDELGRLERVIRRAVEVHHALAARAQADAELTASEKRLAGFAKHLQTTIEQERAEIAREIHDDIGGSLAAANLDLAWLSRHESSPDMLGHIQAASEMLQHAMGASQRIMMNLRPSILDQGLVPAVQWLVNSFEKRTGIRVTLRTNSDDLRFSKPVELTAYRTAQEALTNISKHSSCNLVQIEISDAESVLTLEVSDNGQGIKDSENGEFTGYGLKGLQERAKGIGGWLDISSRKGYGTSIILSIPLSSSGQLAEEEYGA